MPVLVDLTVATIDGFFTARLITEGDTTKGLDASDAQSARDAREIGIVAGTTGAAIFLLSALYGGISSGDCTEAQKRHADYLLKHRR